MKKNILVIGGTRFFGRLLVQGLIERGNDVTIATRGLAADTFGDSVRRIRVDRRDADAMKAVFASADHYDIVYDQMCYSPLDADISIDAFQGKVGRYVMASTIEVYRDLQGLLRRPFVEDDVDLSIEKIDYEYPWHDAESAQAAYGAGKRQAESRLYHNGALPVVSVRIGHVLAGPEDFTGRVADYIDRAQRGDVLAHSGLSGISSFIDPAGIVAFLLWVGTQTFLGPINAASKDPLSAVDLHEQANRILNREGHTRLVPTSSTAEPLSPFDYPTPYVMSTARAAAFGYGFTSSRDWLDGILRQHIKLTA